MQAIYYHLIFNIKNLKHDLHLTAASQKITIQIDFMFFLYV